MIAEIGITVVVGLVITIGVIVYINRMLEMNSETMAVVVFAGGLVVNSIPPYIINNSTTTAIAAAIVVIGNISIILHIATNMLLFFKRQRIMIKVIISIALPFTLFIALQLGMLVYRLLY